MIVNCTKHVLFSRFRRAEIDSFFVDAIGHNGTMARRRRNERIAEWAIRGLSRGVLGIVIVLIAAYFVYRIVVWAFADAARSIGH